MKENLMNQRSSFQTLLCFALSTAFAVPSAAQTLLSKPEFINNSDLVKPNVMLTLDNSGSMNDIIAFNLSTSYIPRKDVNGNPQAPSTASINACNTYVSNAANYDKCRLWHTFYRTRMEYAKTVTWNTFYGLENKLRVGLFELYQNNPRLNLAPWQGAQKNNFYNQLMALSPDSGTPLHETLNRVGNHFSTASSVYASDTSNFSGEVSCRANYHVLVTDGIWNGNTLNRGNVDGSHGPVFTSPTGAPYQYRANRLSPVTCTAASPLGCTHGVKRSDAISNTLADEAMYWWKTDSRPNLANNVRRKASDPNPAFWQNITLYGVVLDISGTLTGVPAWPTPGWPNPYASEQIKVDDLRHAAHNTFGKFFSTSSPAQYEQALKDILADIPTEVGTQSSSAVSGRVVAGNGVVYEPSYRAGIWDGNIQAKTLNANGSIVANPVVWDAKVLLTASLDPPLTPVPVAGEALHQTRKILTYNPSTQTGVPFRHASLSSAQQTAVKGGLTSTQNGADIVNYLRGERYYEQRFGSAASPRPFRNRDGYLGAIVNATPFVVREAWRNGFAKLPAVGATYSAFLGALNARPPTVWAGASDGMLHVLNATTGVELMAYVPSVAYDAGTATAPDYRLFKLSQTNYDHQYIVDGQLAESPWHNGTAWRAMTIAGLGAGGRAWAAFDTTTTADYADQSEAALTAKVQWEFSPSTAGTTAAQHLGYSFGQAWTLPFAATTGSGTGKSTTTQWGTFIGNGYGSPSGAAALFVLNPATGALIHTLVLESPSTYALGAANGLSTPRPVYDAQGRVKAIYAGDLRGNMWKITVAGTGPSQWTVLKLYAGDSAQPITTMPEVDYAPNGSQYQILVGTGKLLHAGDKASTTPQYFLSIIDGNQTTPAQLADLATLTVTRTGTAVTLDQPPPSNSVGYKIRLPSSGDRVLVAPYIYRGVLYFSSFNPLSVNANTDPCADSASASDSVVYAIEPRTGGYPTKKNGYAPELQVGAVVNAGLGGFSVLRSAAMMTDPDGSVTVNPNSMGGACYILVNKLNGTSQTLPMKCPTPNPVRYWRMIPGGGTQ